MNRLLLIGIFIAAASLLHAKVIEVGNGKAVGKIKEAIALSSDGDIIKIFPGIYSEGQIVVDKSIAIIGVDFPIIDGQSKTEILTIIADDVTIEGLQIQHVGTSYLEDRAGIRVKNSKRFKISNNRLYDTFFGIYLERCAHGEISDNIIVGEAQEEMSSGNAIHMWYCKNIEVIDNHVSHHRDGIYLEFVDHSRIENNISSNHLRYGLHFMFSNDDVYIGNRFEQNGAGVAVMFSKKINMKDNDFDKNWGKASYGLLLKEIYDAEITHNRFVQNTIAIYVEGSTRIQYEYNDFERNGWAIKVSGGCLENSISHNNFMSNTFDLSVSNNINENTFQNNYWSDYTGYDLDKDGIGDVPYRPVKLYNFVVNRTPEAMVLLRSFFVDLINFSERVSPIFTPKNVVDDTPFMKPVDTTLL